MKEAARLEEMEGIALDTEGGNGDGTASLAMGKQQSVIKRRSSDMARWVSFSFSSPPYQAFNILILILIKLIVALTLRLSLILLFFNFLLYIYNIGIVEHRR